MPRLVGRVARDSAVGAGSLEGADGTYLPLPCPCQRCHGLGSERGLATPSPDGEGDISSLSLMIMPFDS